MTVDELNKCAALLGEVGLNFAKLATEQSSAQEAGMVCILAQSYLVELASHMQAGMEPFDAYDAAARGTLNVPGPAATTLQILAAKPTK